MSATTRRAGLLSVLLAATLALVPASTAHADGIRAQEWGLEAVHAQQAWGTTKGDGVTVAVLDTGVDADHPDLKGQVLPAKDLIGLGAAPGDPQWALHGTGMASVIAGHGHGAGDEDGVLGIAPEAKILPVRVILEDKDPQREQARTEKAGATAAPAQAGLGNEAQGLADRIERALRKDVTSPTENPS